MAQFHRYIGIDYSGAETATSRLSGLQVVEVIGDGKPQVIRTPSGTGWKWSRKEIAHWLAERLKADEPMIVGLDHGFSFPQTYFDRYGLTDWDTFLADFCKNWCTADDHVYVDFVREENPQRTGSPTDFRLTERWTVSAKSVFHFDVQGQVAKSSHAGIPWLKFLRDQADVRRRVHFWPFDGFDVPVGKSVIVEVYPALFRNRYKIRAENNHERDACTVALWLREKDVNAFLPRYFDLPLTSEEIKLAKKEGWILGVC